MPPPAVLPQKLPFVAGGTSATNTVTDLIKPPLDFTRGLLDQLGFRHFDIIMRVVSWSGGRPGAGTKTFYDERITLNDARGSRIKVKRLSSRDIIASGGKYIEGDFRIGPMTPSWPVWPQTPVGGVVPAYFNPAVAPGLGQEVFFRLTGPGMEAGNWFRKVDQRTDPVFRVEFVIRAISTPSP